MKRILFFILLIFCTNLQAQEDVTDHKTVIKMYRQIHSIDFKTTKNGFSIGFVGRVGYTEVYWMKVITEDEINYKQFIKDNEINMIAVGHTITTDLDGENPRGVHERKLKYVTIY